MEISQQLRIIAWGEEVSNRKDSYAAALEAELLKSNFVVSTEKNKKIPIVFLEFTARQFFHLGSKVKKAIVIFEPRVVNPLQYKLTRFFTFTNVISSFYRVPESSLVWNHGQVKDFTKFFEKRTGNIIRNFEPNTVGIVNANKHSAVLGSQYTTRIDCINALARSEVRVHVAGPNWNKSTIWNAGQFFYSVLLCISSLTFPNTKNFRRRLATNGKNIELVGPVVDAAEFLAQYEYALVIENELTYVSEKIFNAFQAGRLPIYIGPNTDLLDLPSNTYIRFSGSPSELPMFLQTLKPALKNQVLDNIENWLRSEETQDRWSWEKGIQRLANNLIEQFSSQLI